MKQRLRLCIIWCCFLSVVGCDVGTPKKTTVTVNIKQPYLYPDYCAEVEQLLWRHTVKSFRRFIAADDVLEEETLSFLKDVCHYSAYHNLLPRPVELEARGRKLVTRGVDTPVVRMWWGYLLDKCGQKEDAWRQLQQSLGEGTPPYSYVLASYAASKLCEIAHNSDYPMRAERNRWEKK